MSLHVYKIAPYDHKAEFPIDQGTIPEKEVVEDYSPTASDFFDELTKVLEAVPDFHKVYNLYDTVFQAFLNQNTRAQKAIFVGAFAKTDYLLKEHKASLPLIRAVNDTRVRLRKIKDEKLPPEEYEGHYLHDLKNICEFIALVYTIEIPAALRSHFPSTEDTHPHVAPLVREHNEYIRVLLNKWDDDYIYCTAEDATDMGEIKISYTHENLPYNYDWTYLRELFYERAQLNIIRPRQEEGILYPELIILEPDYLVNISNIAHCFTNYAESPLVDLLKKIEPTTESEATLLGNFASQLLDEALCKDHKKYEESVKDFFKENAISLLTTNVSKQFHADAQRQKENIETTISETLPSLHKEYTSQKGIVEPSFFSEMLGLQGRMDYLQLDFKYLMEQKSGKGEFPFGNFTVPRYKEEHYVQMLLYRLILKYNYRDIYEKNQEELQSYLLYSKYTKSLLRLGSAPELEFKALKVRNGIAWCEMQYTHPSGMRILSELTPNTLNEKHTSDPLWNNYQYPQIERSLAPIHEATPLERAYYFRFLTFIANEQMMSKLGNKTKECSGFASAWHDSLEAKLAAGNLYNNLELILNEANAEEKVRDVRLRFSETIDNVMSNFRKGDIVVLYPYKPGEVPDIRATMVFRSTIKDITPDTITLTLRTTQWNRVFLDKKEDKWAIEHDYIDSSFSSLYRGMHAFLSAPQERRDLLLLQRTPEINEKAELKGEYGEFNELVLRMKKAKDLFLIIGPPGTGKTSFGLLNTLKEELLESGTSVLLVSYTNRAVDEICGKLEENNIDYIRIGSEISCDPAYKDKLLSTRSRKCDRLTELRQQYFNTRVIVGTTSSLNSRVSLFQLKPFSLCIVDEASQILEPHLIGLLSAKYNDTTAIRKFVLIGDHKQLPAVVQQPKNISEVHDADLENISLTDCRKSLFERLYKKYKDDPTVTYTLTKQGRMHTDISQFPSKAFYNNILRVADSKRQEEKLPKESKGKDDIENMLRTRRVVFITAKHPVETESKKVNQVEADIIAATVLRVYAIEKKHFDANRTVGVIVPYRNQVTTVRKTIDRLAQQEKSFRDTDLKALHDITIDTVERFQGSQRRYILYGFTIQKYHQLNFLTDNTFREENGNLVDRKLNVVMTRAQEHLILVGNPSLLKKNQIFLKLMEFIREHHGYFDVKKEDYLKGAFLNER